MRFKKFQLVQGCERPRRYWAEEEEEEEEEQEEEEEEEGSVV